MKILCGDNFGMKWINKQPEWRKSRKSFRGRVFWVVDTWLHRMLLLHTLPSTIIITCGGQMTAWRCRPHLRRSIGLAIGRRVALKWVFGMPQIVMRSNFISTNLTRIWRLKSSGWRDNNTEEQIKSNQIKSNTEERANTWEERSFTFTHPLTKITVNWLYCC